MVLDLRAGVPAPALILGFAQSLGEDIEAALPIYPNAVLFGVNRAAKLYRCQHLVSLDKHKIPGFIPDYPITVHAGRFGGVKQQHGPKDYIDCYWPHLQTGVTSGSSGWLAAKIAVKLGHAPVVMCGCPIDNSAHVEPDTGYHESLWNNPKQFGTCREYIVNDSDYHEFVFSMSGWSREFLGYPRG